MEDIKNYLFELCSENAPSGREELLCSLERLVRPYADKCYRDNTGNLVAVKYAKTQSAGKIMLDAHADEVGLVVTGIDDSGFIHFANHTGIDSRILPASTVTVLSKVSLTGVVSTLPPHLLKQSDTKKVIKADEMVIDVGFDANKVRQLVKVGDFITLRSTCIELCNDIVMGKSFDNRASCAALINFLKIISKLDLQVDVYAVFSAAEEFGGYGAKAAAFEICPDKAVVLDTTFALSPYTTSESKAKKLGGGPAIAVSPLLSSHFTQNLVGLCRSRNIPYQTEVLSGRTGTNADSIVPTRTGVQTALVSIPLRYMHSAGELVSLSDIQNVSKILLAFVSQKGGGLFE